MSAAAKPNPSAPAESSNCVWCGRALRYGVRFCSHRCSGLWKRYEAMVRGKLRMAGLILTPKKNRTHLDVLAAQYDAAYAEVERQARAQYASWRLEHGGAGGRTP